MRGFKVPGPELRASEQTAGRSTIGNLSPAINGERYGQMNASIRFASHQNSQENSFPFGYIGSLCSQHFKQSWMDVVQDHASPNRQQEKPELQGFKIAVPNCNLILNTKSWTWLWDWFVPMNPWIMWPASKPWVNNPRRYHVCLSFSTGSHQSMWNLKLVDPSLCKLFFVVKYLFKALSTSLINLTPGLFVEHCWF